MTANYSTKLVHWKTLSGNRYENQFRSKMGRLSIGDSPTGPELDNGIAFS